MLRYLYFMMLTLSLMATQWQSEDVDAPYGFITEPWYQNRINVIDNQNHMHVVYGGDGVFHKWFDGSQWQGEMLDTTHDSGRGVTVAIDANDKLHVAYFDEQNQKIMYATNISGVWKKKKILDTYQFLMISITVDKSAKAHVAYEYGAGMKYATNSSGNWVSETVQNLAVDDFRILVNSADKPYILYQNASGDLTLSSRTASIWSDEIVKVDANVKDLDAAFDSSDKLHLIYSRSIDNNLSYISNVLGVGSWSTILLAGNAKEKKNTSIAVDNQSHVYITASEYNTSTSSYNAAYFTNKTNTFEYEHIESNFFGSASISVDANHNAHITAISLNDIEELKYYTNALGNWSSSILDTNTHDREKPSLAISNNGHIFVSDNMGKYGLDMLQFASNQHTTFSVEPIEEHSNSHFSAIGVDSNEKVHISYFGTNKQLRYATNALGTWSYITLESNTNSGNYNALAVDKDDNIHICYFDNNTSEFKYITNAEGGWSTEVLETSIYGGKRPAITIEHSGKVHIVFSDNDNLYYASKNVSGSFSIELLPKPSGSGSGSGSHYRAHSDIAVDARGVVHITSGIGSINEYKATYITNKLGAWTAIEFERVMYYYYVDEHSGRSIAVTENSCIYLTADNYLYSNCSGEWLGEIAGGDDTIVRLDKQGKVHIVYEKNGNIFHAIKKEKSAVLVPIINYLLN